MTYRELLKGLKKLTKRQLDTDVTVYDDSVEEYIPAHELYITGKDNDVLPNNPVVVIK